MNGYCFTKVLKKALKEMFIMKSKIFLVGLICSLCFCGCGTTTGSKSDFEYKLLDNLVEEKMDDIVIFTPNVYEVGSESMCEKYMISAGYIQKFRTTDDWGVIKDGKIEQVYSDNHTSVEDFGQVDGLCAPGYLIKADFDLYSAASLEKEKNNGTDISKIDQTGQYWILYLARENEETGYILALNTKYYMREDMLEWAKSFKF